MNLLAISTKRGVPTVHQIGIEGNSCTQDMYPYMMHISKYIHVYNTNISHQCFQIMNLFRTISFQPALRRFEKGAVRPGMQRALGWRAVDRVGLSTALPVPRPAGRQLRFGRWGGRNCRGTQQPALASQAPAFATAVMNLKHPFSDLEHSPSIASPLLGSS